MANSYIVPLHSIWQVFGFRKLKEVFYSQRVGNFETNVSRDNSKCTDLLLMAKHLLGLIQVIDAF